MVCVPKIGRAGTKLWINAPVAPGDDGKIDECSLVFSTVKSGRTGLLSTVGLTKVGLGGTDGCSIDGVALGIKTRVQWIGVGPSDGRKLTKTR